MWCVSRLDTVLVLGRIGDELNLEETVYVAYVRFEVRQISIAIFSRMVIS
jgi:hypothetical protein